MQKQYRLYGFLIFVLFTACAATSAFSQAIESRAEVNKAVHPVFESTFPNSSGTIKGALLDRLRRDHIRAKSKKNTITCEGVVYPVLAATPLDLYFQIEGKSKRKKGSAILKLFVSKGKGNFIGKQYDPELSQKALDFLNSFQKDVDRYALNQDISQKEKELKKAQSGYEKQLKEKQKLTQNEYDLKRSLSGEQDQKAQKKLSKKISKTDKRLNSISNSIRKSERDLQQRKTEIQMLREQLSRLIKE